MKTFAVFLHENRYPHLRISVPALKQNELYAMRWSGEIERHLGRWAFASKNVNDLVDAVGAYETRFRAAEHPEDYRSRPAHGFIHVGRVNTSEITKSRSTSYAGMIEIQDVFTHDHLDVIYELSTGKPIWKR